MNDESDVNPLRCQKDDFWGLLEDPDALREEANKVAQLIRYRKDQMIPNITDQVPLETLGYKYFPEGRSL